MMYERVSDEELRENGWDPAWIQTEEDDVGPYAVTRENTNCGHCGNNVFGWTVIDLETATGVSVSWTHEDGEIDAREHAAALNAAWVAGYRSREVRQ